MNRLKQLRLARNYSQRGLAIASGVSRRTIIDLERDRFNPYTYTRVRLAKALRVDIEDIWR